MLEIVSMIVTIGIAVVAIKVYYKTLEESSRTRRDFRNDGQLHMIYPQ